MKELLNDVEMLKRQIASVEKEELISIHFFSEAFDLLYKVQEGLIAMESDQIERLRCDMEMRKVKLSGLKEGAFAAVPQPDMELGLPVIELMEEAIIDNPVVSEKVVRVVENIAAPVLPTPASAIVPSSPAEAKTDSPKNKDIRVLLSLNDRFRFQRELFDGDGLAFNGLLDRLNLTKSLAEATKLLRAETGWNEEDETTIEFFTVVERFFFV